MDGVQFTEQAARRIANVVTQYEKEHLSATGKRKPDIKTNPGAVVFKAPSSGIQARNGLDVSKAECTIYRLDRASEELKEGSTVDVWNLTTENIAADSYNLVTRDRQGNFIVENQSLPPVGLFKVTFTSDLDTTDATAQIQVAKSDLSGTAGATTANNHLALDADNGAVGYCWLYDDGTIDLIAAKCPE